VADTDQKQEFRRGRHAHPSLPGEGPRNLCTL
jgi:hypothetical protein